MLLKYPFIHELFYINKVTMLCTVTFFVSCAILINGKKDSIEVSIYTEKETEILNI